MGSYRQNLLHYSDSSNNDKTMHFIEKLIHMLHLKATHNKFQDVPRLFETGVIFSLFLEWKMYT